MRSISLASGTLSSRPRDRLCLGTDLSATRACNTHHRASFATSSASAPSASSSEIVRANRRCSAYPFDRRTHLFFIVSTPLLVVAPFPSQAKEDKQPSKPPPGLNIRYRLVIDRGVTTVCMYTRHYTCTRKIIAVYYWLHACLG